MEAFRSLLLEVWREACQHIQVTEACTTIGQYLSREMPLSAIVVLRFDANQQLLTAVAEAMMDRAPAVDRFRHIALSAAEAKRLVAWSREATIRHQKPGDARRDLLNLAGQNFDREVLSGPLRGEHGAAGLLILIAQPKHSFAEKHERIANALLEPFSVALENDRRLHELAALREAAEADRRSLLARLGRRELTETVIGAEQGLRPVMERVELVAAADVPVLILGETGTGKEVVARAIHARSPRTSGPFIRVNCGAIPAELIDSHLFGHEKGSFTGAAEMRQGWFERADGGTLFLDEIGELPLAAQVRLLRVLQDGFLERVGGHQPIHVDVRIVAATHRDLAAMVSQKEFREDLWYRLAVFPILLPPLRERQEDIEELSRHFAERAAIRFSLPIAMPDSDDIRLLQSYAWPGNVRELGTVIDRAAILGEGQRLEIGKALGIHPVTVPARATAHAPQLNHSPNHSGSIVTLNEAMKRHIEAALSATKGRIEGSRGAAILLGINPHTLRARMRKLGIKWSGFRD